KHAVMRSARNRTHCASCLIPFSFAKASNATSYNDTAILATCQHRNYVEIIIKDYIHFQNSRAAIVPFDGDAVVNDLTNFLVEGVRMSSTLLPPSFHDRVLGRPRTRLPFLSLPLFLSIIYRPRTVRYSMSSGFRSLRGHSDFLL